MYEYVDFIFPLIDDHFSVNMKVHPGTLYIMYVINLYITIMQKESL